MSKLPDQITREMRERAHNVEILISSILRIGVTVSLLVIVIGTVLSFVRHPEYIRSRRALEHLTDAAVTHPQSIADVKAELRQMHGQAVVVVGLLLLIATPVVRVAVSIFAFVYQRDRVFIAITTLVLTLLLLSFFLGKVEG